MDIKVKDVMTKEVISTVPHKSVGHIKNIMRTNEIKLVPVVDSDNFLLGLVTAADVLGIDDGKPVKQIMITEVVTIPAYASVQNAARAMRNRGIHHLIVTDEKKLAGVLSSFDLLKLVENKRFIMKNPPTPSKKGPSKRKRY